MLHFETSSLPFRKSIETFFFLMNWLDILILILLCFFGALGYKRGLVFGICLLLGSIVGSFIGMKFSESLALHLKNSYNNNSYFLISIAFFLIFMATYIGFWFLGKFISKTLKIINLSQLIKFLAHLFIF